MERDGSVRVFWLAGEIARNKSVEKENKYRGVGVCFFCGEFWRYPMVTAGLVARFGHLGICFGVVGCSSIPIVRFWWLIQRTFGFAGSGNRG